MPTAQSPFSTAGVHSFSQWLSEFVLYNDGTTDVSFYFDSASTEVYTVKQGESFDEQVAPYSKVTVTAPGAFRAYGRR